MTTHENPVTARHAAPADVLDLSTGQAVAEPVAGYRRTRSDWRHGTAADEAAFMADRVALFADVFAAMAEGCQFAPDSMGALSAIARDTHADLTAALGAMDAAQGIAFEAPYDPDTGR